MLKPKRTPKPKPTPAPLGHVLVVEDDTILSMALEDALLDAGAGSVEVVASTAQALAALRDKRPDAVVLDVHLTDSDDGWEVAELASAAGPQPPRIIFSTGSPEEIPAKIARMGAVLAKPYDPKDLIACLQAPQHRGLFSRLRGK